MADRHPDYKTEDAILRCCDDPHQRYLGQTDDCGANLVVRYLEDAVVKFGALDEREVANQRLARTILNPKIVRVPEVYHYFKRGRTGYLVMEYIKGTPCKTLAQPEEIERIAVAVEHVNSHHADGNKLGPVNGGETQGVLWHSEGIEVEDMDDLEKYFNDRLVRDVAHEAPVCFRKSSIVFVHCNIAQQKIIWCDDGTVALLDWAQAGCYETDTWDSAYLFFEALAARLKMRTDEAEQARKVLIAQDAAFAYGILSKDEWMPYPALLPSSSRVEQLDDTDSSDTREVDDTKSGVLFASKL
ncbi:hypothetical protein LTR22_002833 [Elasticomyces elasticus]|nr:hypothetical protein LTR22_002833 [Elasticomyces elasticus]KAK4910345.1 hypothetical protein LTR49_020952 [Elasticomyces elasticus]KAK5763601.1 hypothetical protein LTS12_006158 [Elasticomyces elasticus]